MATTSSSFKRYLSPKLIAQLKEDPFFKVLQSEIQNQQIFPGIRNNLIDFYHKGGRLFKYDAKGFQTHIKYAAVIEKADSDYLTENELNNYKLATNFQSNYERIKENCSNYSGVEAKGVSEIYHRHSFMDRDKEIVVLDIEVSFKAIDANKKQDRIDILLYNLKERKLKFVEAKHYSNSEIWSTTEAKVIKQIHRYESQIKSKKMGIIEEYNKYIEIANDMFSCNLPTIKDIEEKVALLVFGFDKNQQNGRLQELVTKNEAFNNIPFYPKGDVKKMELTQLWKAKPLKNETNNP